MKTDSKYLLTEQPITFYPSLALAVGSDQAIIIQQIRYWMNYNAQDPKKLSTHFREDRWWTYNTFDQWSEVFCWLSVRTIKRHFSALVKQGVLLQNFYHDDPRNRTLWYSIDFEKLDRVVATAIKKNAQKTPETHTLQDDANLAQCEVSDLHYDLYTETTNRELQELREEYKVSPEAPPRLRSTPISDFGQEDGNQEPQSQKPTEQVPFTTLAKKRNPSRSEKNSGADRKDSAAAPRFSTTKINNRAYQVDSRGAIQLPNVPNQKLARSLAYRAMQFEIWQNWSDEGFDLAVAPSGSVYVYDPFVGEWEDEDQLMPIAKMLDLAGSSNSPLWIDVDLFNERLIYWFDACIDWLAKLPNAIQVVKQKSMALWMKLEIDEVEWDDLGYES